VDRWYLSARWDKWGIPSLQGLHHVAQNSTTYTLPFSKVLTGCPLIHLAMVIGGAISQISSFFISGWVCPCREIVDKHAIMLIANACFRK